jgi:predicted glutamine amidotransferase
MCGLAFLAGIENADQRHVLIRHLGRLIDSRGDAMAGFVGTDKKGTIVYHRKRGDWSSASDQFYSDAASADTLVMHSRAPGHNHPVENAHPFQIERGGKTVLYGVHNGSLNEAFDIAKRHNRKIAVDSHELFNLIADQAWDELNLATGWGVALWIATDNLQEIKAARLSHNSDLALVSVKGGGYVGASTLYILKTALSAAGLEVEKNFDKEIREVGRVVLISDSGLKLSDNRHVAFKAGSRFEW